MKTKFEVRMLMMRIGLVLVSYLAMTMSISPNANAILGIPGTPSLPGDPGDDARKVERKIKCDNIRADADHHLAEIQPQVANANAQLQTDTNSRDQEVVRGQALKSMRQQMAAELAALNEMRPVLEDLQKNEAEIRAKIGQTSKNTSARSLDEMLTDLARHSNKRIQGLVTLIKSLKIDDADEIQQLILKNKTKSLLRNLSGKLIVSVTATGNHLIEIDKQIELSDGSLQGLGGRLAALNGQLADLNGQIQSQEERKKCKF